MKRDEQGEKRPDPREIAERLKHLRDEVLMRNHRAPPELKDAVALVAAELAEAAEKLTTAAPALAMLRDEATVQGHLALLEAKDKLELLEDVVRRALAGAATSPTFIGETARLKLALARMEAADLFQEKRRLLREERRRFEANTEAALRDVEDRLAELIEAADGGRRS